MSPSPKSSPPPPPPKSPPPSRSTTPVATHSVATHSGIITSASLQTIFASTVEVNSQRTDEDIEDAATELRARLAAAESRAEASRNSRVERAVAMSGYSRLEQVRQEDEAAREDARGRLVQRLNAAEARRVTARREAALRRAALMYDPATTIATMLLRPPPPPPEPDELSAWLESVGTGYAQRFLAAFNVAGIDDMQDLVAVAADPNLVDALLATLNRAGARVVQMAIIERAVRRL